jgi:outer membrane receptor for ferrienterochelin and colicin
MQAISDGQYEKGIAELKLAYDTLPHPNVLYNIARAYAESGDLDSAVGYYRKYLAENPSDKEEVEAVVKSLEARLAKSKAAAAAAAAAAGGSGAGAGGGAAGGGAGAGAPDAGATAGSGAAAPGGAPGAPSGGAAPGGAAPVGPTPASASDSGGKGEIGASKTEDVYETKVVTASKAEQSPLDSPSSTFVITEQDIRLSGITTVPELMQRVPGIDSAQLTATDHNLSIRGFNGRLSNKLLVLVDGRSVYLDFLGTTFWDMLSINVEDIARIEVVRGPGSALYGADAFTGVVNIITKAPGGEGTKTPNGATVGVGHQAAGLGYYRGALWANGKSNGWNYRISTGFEQQPRWMREVGKDRVDLGYFTNNYDLGARSMKADVRVTRRFGKDTTFGIGGGYTQAYRNFYGLGSITDTGVDMRLGDITTFLTTKHFSVRSFFYSISADAAPSVRYLGDAATTTHPLSRVWDVDPQYSADFTTGPLAHDLKLGLGYRFKDIDWNWNSPTYHVEHHFNGFVQDTVKIGEKVIVVGSFRGDRVPYLQKVIFSPRGSFIYKRTKDDAFRFTASAAFRKPTFLESYLDYPVTTPNSGAEVASQSVKADDPDYKTKQERIVALEAGYTNQASDFLTLEFNAYYNRVTDLVVLAQLRSQTPSTYAKGAGGYNEATGRYTAGYTGFTNDCQIFHSYGGEAGFRAFPVTGVDVYASYAYNQVDQVAPDGCKATVKDQRTSNHKVIAGAQWRSKFGLDAELDVWFQSRQIWAEQRVNIATREVEYQRFALDAFPLVNGRVGYNFKGEPLSLGLTFSNLLDNKVREHPFGQVLGRRLIASLTYRY